MKPSLRSLRRGQEVWALVEETIEGGEVVINFSGDLVRTENLTGKTLRPGQRVLLVVDSIHPLKLRLINRRAVSRSPGRFDLTI
jgi:hypothetical protein